MTSVAHRALYGVPLSQPFRAVAWTLLQLGVPFEVKYAVPGRLRPDFLAKSSGRSTRIPLLEDGDRTIVESPAILMYLCETYTTSTDQNVDLYAPIGSPAKTLIDSYLHSHHEGTRQLFRLTKPFLRPAPGSAVTDEDREIVHAALTALDQGWLGGGTRFIASDEQHSIADIMAYEEIAQATMMSPDDTLLDGMSTKYPNIHDWVQRMRELPFHEPAHVALETMGSLTSIAPEDLPKRLGAATKNGMKALQDAQK